MRTLLFTVSLGALLRARDPHPVELAKAQGPIDGNDAQYVRACAAYMHEMNAAMAAEPCSARANKALAEMRGAAAHCKDETFGSSTSGTFQTSLDAYADEFQRRCIGLCDPKCVHGQCTAFQQCTCEEKWHGPTCAFPVCEGGCGEGVCMSDGKCKCPEGWSGVNCEVAPVTTTTTTTTTTTAISYEACATLAADVVVAANGGQICEGAGNDAYQAFEAQLPGCREYHIGTVERAVGHLEIERKYDEIHQNVLELHGKCAVPTAGQADAVAPLADEAAVEAAASAQEEAAPVVQQVVEDLTEPQ